MVKLKPGRDQQKFRDDRDLHFISNKDEPSLGRDNPTNTSPELSI